MGTRSGFLVGSEKGEVECDVGLGLRMQKQDQSFGSRKMMTAPLLPHHPLSSSSAAEPLAGGAGAGPRVPVTSGATIYDAVGAAAILPKTLLPFASEAFAFGSSGGMAASLRVPFTAAQWQELERQTIIYKYMMASIPVPPELLISITKPSPNLAPSNSNQLLKGSLELGLPSNSDPEPWRCRRTDGKKWRCSRDVAPDQKYCERHSHKTRPRSRKPVESHPNNAAHTPNYPNHGAKPLQRTHLPVYPAVVSSTQCSEWYTRAETPRSNQDWPHMAQPKAGLRRQQPAMEPYAVYGHGRRLEGRRLNEDSSLLLSPLEGALGSGQTQETRHFIDAWSTAERDRLSEISNRCSVSSNDKLPLSLSVAAGADHDNEDGNAGLVTPSSERENVGESKPHWMSPVSWMGSHPGGPLAEALCLGISGGTATNATASSPYGCNSSTTSSSKSSCADGGFSFNLTK